MVFVATYIQSDVNYPSFVVFYFDYEIFSAERKEKVDLY